MRRTAAAIMLLVPTMIPGLSADYWHGDFTDDRTLVFEEEATLYSAPDTGSEAVAVLSAGTGVTVAGPEGQAALENGAVTYWYRVTVLSPDGEFSGYIPGTSLAMTDLQLGADTLFMFTVTGYDPEEHFFRSSARVIASGEILDEVEFRPVDGGFGRVPYSYSVRSLPLDPGGLSGVRHLMELSFIYEACGFLNSDILFAWTGRRLIMGPKADSQFEASQYRYIETFVIPADSGGVPQEIVVKATISEWDEDIDDYVVTDSFTTGHGWNGSGFDPEEDPY